MFAHMLKIKSHIVYGIIFTKRSLFYTNEAVLTIENRVR